MRVLTVVLLAVWITFLGAAEDDPQDRASLRDLDGVRVAVEELPQALSAKGLSRDRLRGSVESKLRQAGIPILNPGEFPVGDPYLDVRITTSKESGGWIGYSLEVGFLQIVFMRRNPAVTFNRAPTWKAALRVRIVRPALLSATIEADLSQQIDQFVKAYWAANSK